MIYSKSYRMLKELEENDKRIERHALTLAISLVVSMVIVFIVINL